MTLARCDLVSLLLIYLPVAYQHFVEAVCSHYVQYLADAIFMQMCVALCCMLCEIFFFA